MDEKLNDLNCKYLQFSTLPLHCAALNEKIGHRPIGLSAIRWPAGYGAGNGQHPPCRLIEASKRQT